MKQTFLLFACSIISIAINAQSPLEQYQIGYWYDINQDFIDGYYDIQYNPKKSVQYSYTLGDQFVQGHYYNEDGERIEGLLKYNQWDGSLLFSKTKEDKSKTLSTEICRGYVIGKDSFAVISGFEIQTKLMRVPADNPQFVEVMEKFDNLIFYKHLDIFNQKVTTTYIVRDINENNYVSFPKTKTKFVNTAVPYFESFGALKDGIISGKYKEEDIPTLIKMLKYKNSFDKSRKILFDANWKETEDSTNYFYYASINSIMDSVMNVSYFLKSGVKVHEGDFTSFYPHRNKGAISFYFPNGTIRKKITEINKTIYGTIYHSNSQLRLKFRDSEYGTRYEKVCDINGVNLLDVKGDAVEHFYDSIGSRMIISTYTAFQLKTSYYTDVTGRKVYLFSDKNRSPTYLKVLQASFTNALKYPESSILNNTEGVALISCLVEPIGEVSTMKLIKGIDKNRDQVILDILSKAKKKPIWKVIKVDGEKVAQEIIIPLQLNIIGFSLYRNYNSSFMLHQQQMWMMQQPMHIPQAPPSIPSPRF